MNSGATMRERGQGLIEYALILVIVIVIIVVGIKYILPPIISFISPDKAPSSEDHNTSNATQSTTSGENTSIGDIQITNENFEQVIAIDPIFLPNCYGSETLRMNRTLEKNIVSEIHFDLDTSLSGAIAPEVLTAAIEAKTGTSEQEEIRESFQIEISAAPGTQVWYEIEWIEVSISGIVEIIIDGVPHFQEFTETSSIKARMTEKSAVACPTAGN